MKHFIILSILLSAAQCLRAQEGNTIHWDMPGTSIFYGPEQSAVLISSAGIHKEEIYKYTLRRKKVKDSSLLAIFYFDSSGNKTKELIRGHEKDTLVRMYFYDPAHVLIKETYSCRCPKPSTYVTEYKDEAGRAATRFVNNNDTMEWRPNQLYYDDRRNLIMRYQKQVSGDPLYEKYRYDERNRLIHRDVLNPAGEIISSYDIVYNDTARSMITSKNINGLAYPMDKEYYNEKMQLIKKTFGPFSTTLKYNNDGTVKDMKKSDFDMTGFFYNRP